MTQKVSKLNKFFNICLEIIEDKYALQDLSALVEEPQLRMWPEKNVILINRRLKIGRELCMSAQIGEYDMDFIILDVGSDVNILTR